MKLEEKKRGQITKAADNGVEGETGDGDHDHGDQERYVQDQLPNSNTGYRRSTEQCRRFLTNCIKIAVTRVADPDPSWTRIQSGQQIRIRIRNPDPDSDP